jgi:hypothetical protein
MSLGSQEPRIRQLMSDDIARFIARYCKTPHSTSEIVKELLKNRQSTQLSLYEGVVANNLIAMENVKAITYSDGKWQTTEITLQVLEKYFGEVSL